MTADAATHDRDAPAGHARSRVGRFALMALLPLALAIGGGYVWVTGGRFVGTDNAYVQQDKVTLSPDVSGRIVEVGARENQMVAAGDLLFRLDPDPYRLALRRAEAAVASARLDVEQRRAAYQGSLAELRAAEQDLDFREREFGRQQKLAGGGYAAQATFDQARHELQAAEQRLAQARQEVAGALAGLGGDPSITADRHPLVLDAVARRDQAALDLDHATVRAPVDGVVSQTDRLQAGQYIPVGTPVLTLVEARDSWIEANFKETDLTHMTVGQPATVELDAFPGRTFSAEVESIGAGTGSEFSLLPAQNATGNWVKVVQRVPVRLRIEADPAAGVSLRAGLSADVSVDTGHTRDLPGPIRSALALTGIGAAQAAGQDNR